MHLARTYATRVEVRQRDTSFLAFRILEQAITEGQKAEGKDSRTLSTTVNRSTMLRMKTAPVLQCPSWQWLFPHPCS